MLILYSASTSGANISMLWSGLNLFGLASTYEYGTVLGGSLKDAPGKRWRAFARVWNNCSMREL